MVFHLTIITSQSFLNIHEHVGSVETSLLRIYSWLPGYYQLHMPLLSSYCLLLATSKCTMYKKLWIFLCLLYHYPYEFLLSFQDICKSLWCHRVGHRCETKFMPAAEGTVCGLSMVNCILVRFLV